MILKGNQRGGARQLASHLMNGEQNEHVTVHQIRGFLGETVEDALAEELLGEHEHAPVRRRRHVPGLDARDVADVLGRRPLGSDALDLRFGES